MMLAAHWPWVAVFTHTITQLVAVAIVDGGDQASPVCEGGALMDHMSSSKAWNTLFFPSSMEQFLSPIMDLGSLPISKRPSFLTRRADRS